MALSIAAFRRIARDYSQPREPKDRSKPLFLNVVGDEYARRDKTSRDFPRKKQERPTGKLKIKSTSKTQIQTAKAIKQKNGERC